MNPARRRTLVFGVLAAFSMLFSAPTPTRSTELACDQIGDKWGCRGLPTTAPASSSELACGQIGDKWGCRSVPNI